ncbi:hypothetical protein GEMRC1_004180 [Eukaryota sp. GEM-RC1]
MQNVLIVLGFIGLCFSFNHTATPLTSFRSSSHITVSGLSSGAFMSTQLHVAFSKHIKGMGSFAGGPYWCANANVVIAQTCCMADPVCIIVSELVAATRFARTTLSIDSPSHMEDAKIFVYSPSDDSTVNPGVARKLVDYYEHFVDPSNIKAVFNNQGEHAMPTKKYGSDCLYNGAPYINNCDYDGAREVLDWLIGDLPSVPGLFQEKNLYFFAQRDHLPFGLTLSNLSLGSSGMVYVPEQCLEPGTCPLHVAFHGCRQGLGVIGEVFVRHSGYAQWAEARGIIVLFPQADISSLLPYNPKGCWDIWGYTGADYAVRYGGQMATIRNMLNTVTGLSL